jgi:hypothetical protein
LHWLPKSNTPNAVEYHLSYDNGFFTAWSSVTDRGKS